MAIKVLFGSVLCFCAYFIGREFARGINERILTVSDYILFIQTFKSSVTYSGINMFDFFARCCGREKNFTDFLLENKSSGIKDSVENYKSQNSVEGKCVEIIKPSLLFAQESSDVIGIGALLEEAVLSLEIYKKQLQEELNGKIKTAPRLALMIGVFIAVLLV